MSEIIHIQNVSEAHQFFGLEKPKHPLVSVLRAFGQLAQMDFGNGRYVSNLYSISLKSGIPGTCSYGRNSYDFQEGTMAFTAPGQSVKYDDGEGIPEPKESWSLVFHPDLIRKSELGRKIDSYTFFNYEIHEALHISEEEKESLHEIVRKIEKEYSQNIDRHSQELIISNIKLLLDYCTRYFDRQFYTRTNLNQDIVSAFEQLLKQYYRSDKPEELGVPTVTYCGQELGMSPYYLSDLLKKETGRNASDHIHFFVIERAKTALLNSNDSITQIAYDLGFEYPQHFSKVFKAKTGMSPTQYRTR